MGLKDRSLFSSNKRLEAKIKVSAGMLSSEPLSWLVGGHLLPLSSHSFPSGCCFHLFLLIMTTCMQVLSRFSCVRLLAMPWTVAHQAPLSLGFSRQEYQSELPCLPLADLPNLYNNCGQKQKLSILMRIKRPIYMPINKTNE